MKRYRYISPVCASAELAREHGEDAPEACAIHITRRTARRFDGMWWCHHCLLRELAEHRRYQRARKLELEAKALLDSGQMTEAEVKELAAIWQREDARREHHKLYVRRYRHGELPWQKNLAAPKPAVTEIRKPAAPAFEPEKAA